MDRVPVEFHKNVYLLTKFVAPHDDLKKHLKEGMFDKPNSPGFIHVSFYLLNVHYKDVRSKVQWPVICKQTEKKFRDNVRECLMAIASENPDMNFPPILASHLLLAKGTKFILIMWKFSMVVLRSFMAREHGIILPMIPKPGPCQELTKTFLRNATQANKNKISALNRERENIEQEAKNYLKNKSEEQSRLKAEILKMKENLKEIISHTPANEVAKKRLANVDDNEIIKVWTNSIKTDIKSLEDDQKILQKLNDTLKKLGNIVSILAGNSPTLNAHNFDQINTVPIYKLVPQNMQVLPYSLYNKGNLNLHNFFSLFFLLLKKYSLNSRKHEVQELSKCSNQLQTSNRDLKSALLDFQTLHEQIISFTKGELNKNFKFNDLHIVTANDPGFDKVLFLPSPSIQINSCDVGNIYQNHLKLTPVEGAHKELFSRHAYVNNEKSIYSLKKKPLHVQRINFDDSTCDSSTDKQFQPRFNTPTKIRSAFKNVDKYSRLLSSFQPTSNKVNNSVMMMMSSTGNSMLPLMTKQHSISLLDSRNSSQEISQEPLLMNPHLNSTIENPKLEDKEKLPQKTNKRRSISDLVERYKKILEKKDTNLQTHNSEKPLGEEQLLKSN